jgi:hypothetical protein
VLCARRERGQPARSRPAGRDILLRAYLVLALGAGVATLRATIDVQPLAGATAEDLRGPLADVIAALLPPPPASARPSNSRTEN